MELTDYAGRYDKIRFERTGGVLEVTLHTRGGEALWGAGELLPRAREHAQRLAALPRRMLRHTRTLMVRELRRRLRDEIDLGLAVEALATL